jgi:DNA-binding response OmpR family regulator
VVDYQVQLRIYVMNSNITILIVDDEPNIRLGFRTALATDGYVVDEAENGAVALDYLERSSISLVLLDLHMPGLDGMEVLRRLRDKGNGVPVVIITAYGRIPDAVAAMKLGAIDFLSQPLTPNELRRVVREVIARHAEPEPGPEPMPVPSHTSHATTVTVLPAAVDLTLVKRALNRRDFDRAAELLEQVLDLVPDSAEAHTLMGILHETCGDDHAAYHSYKAALESDRTYTAARDSMRRYCERFGLDVHNKAINPAAK